MTYAELTATQQAIVDHALSTMTDAATRFYGATPAPSGATIAAARDALAQYIVDSGMFDCADTFDSVPL